MFRGYAVYVLMFAALGFGLWFVLRVGQRLEAPAEIAGEWRVQWETASPTDMGFHGVMRVSQSGRFCTIKFDDARTISMKVVDGAILGKTDPGVPVARLSGGGYDMTMHPTAVHDAVNLEIVSRDHRHRGLAERVAAPAERAASSDSSTHTAAPVADARP